MALVQKTLENFNENLTNSSLTKDSILNSNAFGSYHDIFIWIKGLKDSGAVIAGGSILSMIIDNNTSFLNDFDIYVNLKNSQIIYEAIIKLGYKLISSHLSPAYDQSFFKKNNILSRFSFFNLKGLKPIDLMIIDDNVTVNSVVSNFDLSFCEIWFDGENVYSNDPESLKTKTGYLKKDYAEYVFTYFNKFIIRRIKKYSKRGFKIKYDCSKNNLINSALLIEPEIKTIKNPKGIRCPNLINSVVGDFVYPEEWVVKKIYEKFLDIQCNSNFILYKKFNLNEYTVENLFKILKKFYHITNGSIWDINNGILTYIEESDQNRIRDENGRLAGINPVLNEKRIKKKIKFIIKYLLYDDLFNYNLNWYPYFNCVLNKDDNNTPNEFGEYDYVDFFDPELQDKNDYRLLSDVIYIRDVSDFSVYNSEGQSHDVLSQWNIRTYLLKYFYKLNIREELSLKFSNINISKEMEIIEGESFDTVKLSSFLEEDVDNFVFLYESGDKIKGIGLNKTSINNVYNRLIVKCKQEYFGSIDLERVIDKWYMILPVGDSYNNGVLLSKLNLVKDELDKGHKIFLLSKPELIEFVASINNVHVSLVSTFYSAYVNIMAIPINIVSGTHCSEGTQTYVYNDIFIVDENYNSILDTNTENNDIYLSINFPYLSTTVIDKLLDEYNSINKININYDSEESNITNYDSEYNNDLDDVRRTLNFEDIDSDQEEPRISNEQNDNLTRTLLDLDNLDSDQEDLGSENIIRLLNVDNDSDEDDTGSKKDYIKSYTDSESSDEEIFIPYYDDSENEN